MTKAIKPLKRIDQPAWAQGLWRPSRYKILHGGRGGGKSFAVADALLIQGLQRTERILCCREIQSTMRESVHHLLASRIMALGLQDFYRILSTEIRGINGTTFLYKGLRHNAEGLKSTSGLTKAWVEEGQSVREQSWRILLPTVRELGSEVWVTFNPGRRGDATCQRFLINPPVGAWVRKVTWRDNPWFPETLNVERQQDRAFRSQTYAHIWEGAFETEGDKTLIPMDWIEAAVDLATDLKLQIWGQRIAGLDVAGAGAGGDANALAIRHGVSLTYLETWNGLDTSQTTQRAVDRCRALGVQMAFYDSVGLGAGIAGEWGAMSRRGAAPKDIKWLPWNGGAGVLWPQRRLDTQNPHSPRHGDQFMNLKAQAWFGLRSRFFEAFKARHGQSYASDKVIDLPSNLSLLPALKTELCQVEFTTNPAGKTLIHKQGATGVSPNLADALLMAFWPTDQGAYTLGALT